LSLQYPDWHLLHDAVTVLPTAQLDEHTDEVVATVNVAASTGVAAAALLLVVAVAPI
jgi:hypothetical protein